MRAALRCAFHSPEKNPHFVHSIHTFMNLKLIKRSVAYAADSRVLHVSKIRSSVRERTYDGPPNRKQPGRSRPQTLQTLHGSQDPCCPAASRIPHERGVPCGSD